MKLTVKNVGPNPTQVRTTAGVKDLARGASIDAEFTDAEAINLNANTAVFEVQGFVHPGVDTSAGKVDENGDTPEMAGLRKRFDSAWAVQASDLQKARDTLGGIAALFGDNVNQDEIKDKVAAIIAENAALKSPSTGNAGGPGASGPAGAKPTLAEAVTSLDDANDAHWTDGGKPDLETLKELTGAPVKRADVDALTPARVRKVS
jgi:hypothetical protein